MERGHIWNAIRYVEQNPVRARICVHAKDFAWSSAAAHLSGKDPFHLLNMAFWRDSGGAEWWSELLSSSGKEAEIESLRRATYAGKALGSKEFLEGMKNLIMTKSSDNASPGRASSFAAF
jgi:putative transposase